MAFQPLPGLVIRVRLACLVAPEDRPQSPGDIVATIA
jgi:hypothetical protein